MHQPWRRETGLVADADIPSAIPCHRPPDLFPIRRSLATPQAAIGTVDDTDRHHSLGHIKSDIVGHR
jgi:hypothetical protein